MTNSVSHFTSGKEAWQIGLQGLLFRRAGMFFSAVVIVFFMAIIVGLLRLWIGSIPNTVTINFNYLIFTLMVLFITMTIGALKYLHKRTVRSLNIKSSLHVLTHDIRNKNTELHEKFTLENNFAFEQLNKELERLLTAICNNAAEHFKLLTSDRSVCVAIRLASLTGEDDNVAYRTVARSDGLGKKRKVHSQPIPINEGIPRFLREDKQAQGVLIYHDLELAAKDGTYTLTKNDELFCNEIVTMMVAPLNAWSGITEDMIGIMFVTSKNKNTFNELHVDSLAFIADLTAIAISNTVDLVNLKCSTEH